MPGPPWGRCEIQPLLFTRRVPERSFEPYLIKRSDLIRNVVYDNVPPSCSLAGGQVECGQQARDWSRPQIHIKLHVADHAAEAGPIQSAYILCTPGPSIKAAPVQDMSPKRACGHASLTRSQRPALRVKRFVSRHASSAIFVHQPTFNLLI